MNAARTKPPRRTPEAALADDLGCAPWGYPQIAAGVGVPYWRAQALAADDTLAVPFPPAVWTKPVGKMWAKGDVEWWIANCEDADAVRPATDWAAIAAEHGLTPIGRTEIAEMAGVKSDTVSIWIGRVPTTSRTVPFPPATWEGVCNGKTYASCVVEAWLQQTGRTAAPDMARVTELRQAGWSWADVAAEVGSLSGARLRTLWEKWVLDAQ
jgi:hypothetical protein